MLELISEMPLADSCLYKSPEKVTCENLFKMMLSTFTDKADAVFESIDLFAETPNGLETDSLEFFLASVETRARMLLIQHCLSSKSKLPELAIV